MNTPRFPNVEVELVGQDSNAVVIIGRVANALREAGATPAEVTEYTEESMSGDYDNVLRTAMAWVEVS